MKKDNILKKDCILEFYLIIDKDDKDNKWYNQIMHLGKIYYLMTKKKIRLKL